MSNSRLVSTLSVFYRNTCRKLLYTNYSYQKFQMSTKTHQTTALYEEIENAKNNKNVLLIDVRERKEINSTGQIPGSINIPLGELADVLKSMSPEDFQKKYKRDKPTTEFPLIFSCYSGKRAAQARDVAAKLGYQCVRTYPGSWQEWAQKHGLPS